MDHFDQQLELVKSLPGDERVAAASIVAWQGISTTLIELVGRFNSVNLSTDSSDDKRHREAHIKN